MSIVSESQQKLHTPIEEREPGSTSGSAASDSVVLSALQDPKDVYLNMARGTIAKLSESQVRHMYPHLFDSDANVIGQLELQCKIKDTQILELKRLIALAKRERDEANERCDVLQRANEDFRRKLGKYERLMDATAELKAATEALV